LIGEKILDNTRARGKGGKYMLGSKHEGKGTQSKSKYLKYRK
jgi:hypothetical protein